MYRSSVASSYHWSNKARPFFSCMTTKDHEFNSFKKKDQEFKLATRQQ
jgi:hypothetical protein